MKIDKNRFLFLTTSLAATAAAALVVTTSACNTTTTDTDAGNNNPPQNDAGSNEDEGGTNGGDPDASEPGSCLGSEERPPFCSPEVEGVDSGVTAKCGNECIMAANIFKPAVAEDINKCLNTVPDPTEEGACYEKLAPCIADSIAKACDDQAATEFCSAVLATCDEAGAVPTQAECEAVARAMTSPAREAFTTCTVEGGCEVCFDQVKNGTLFVE
jgi:hypothetical protein